MKVQDVIKTIDETEMISRIMGKFQNYPNNSISKRDVVNSYLFPNISQKEAEEIVSQLDKTITSAIMSFKPKIKK